MQRPPWIRLTRWPYEDEVWNLELAAADGEFSAAQEIYVEREDLVELANALCAFPRNRSDEIAFECGEPNPPWAHFVSIRVYLYDAVGHGAIELRLSNNRPKEYAQEAHFTIRCEVASINRLGQAIAVWLRGDELRVEVELTRA